MKFEYKIASVISGYKFSPEPIYSKNKKEVYFYKYNTGIIISYDIKHAVDLIKSNPIGYQIKV